MRQSQAASQLPRMFATSDYGQEVNVHRPSMVVSLYSPKGTYDAKFLANYANITSTTSSAHSWHRRVTVFGPAGQYAYARLGASGSGWRPLNITIPESPRPSRKQDTP